MRFPHWHTAARLMEGVNNLPTFSMLPQCLMRSDVFICVVQHDLRAFVNHSYIVFNYRYAYFDSNNCVQNSLRIPQIGAYST